MPKLNTEQLIERIEGRIAELETGAEIAAKHIRALLTDTQQQALDDALAAQVLLKKAKRARTEEEKTALGWKTIRKVRLDAMNSALTEARAGVHADVERRLEMADVRQAHIYFEALNKAQKEGKDLQAAKTWANNELTRAGLRRMDGQRVEPLSVRDKEVFEMEATLLAKLKAEMSPEQREQQEMLDEFDRLSSKRTVGKASGPGKAR